MKLYTNSVLAQEENEIPQSLDCLMQITIINIDY